MIYITMTQTTYSVNLTMKYFLENVLIAYHHEKNPLSHRFFSIGK